MAPPLALADQVEEENDAGAGGRSGAGRRVRAESGSAGVAADVPRGVAFPHGVLACLDWRGDVPL